MAIDPVTREIMRNRLTAVLHEASIAIKRSAYSSIITETDDYSIALFNRDGALVAQAEQLPLFLGAMPEPMKEFLSAYPADSYREGDIFISNDPYSAGGTHKNDINILMPFFYDGFLRLFVMTKAHWMDVGGKTAGSWSPDSTNTFEEGLSLPPLRLASEGRVNKELEATILANSRIPRENLGDMRAQIAGCKSAITRLNEVCSEFGWSLLEDALLSLMEHSELAMRKAIDAIPDGTYEGRDWVDWDGVTEDPIEVVVTVRVAGEEVELDFSGCPIQSQGSCGNSAYARTISIVRAAVRSLTDPSIPCNEGLFRPIKTVLPAGTVVNPTWPAPVTLGQHVARAAREAVVFAMADVLPDVAIAGQYGGPLSMVIAGRDPRTETNFVFGSPYAGGWGAGRGCDGVFPLMMFSGSKMRNCPIEVAEVRYPLRVERHELRPDSGGAGEFRGGLGVRIDYRIEGDHALLSTAMDRVRFAPPGLSGGQQGANSGLRIIHKDGSTTDVEKVAGLKLQTGDVISHQSGGGGGYGDAARRDRAMVQRDVEEGYVTPKAAEGIYGWRAPRGKAK